MRCTSRSQTDLFQRTEPDEGSRLRPQTRRESRDTSLETTRACPASFPVNDDYKPPRRGPLSLDTHGWSAHRFGAALRSQRSHPAPGLLRPRLSEPPRGVWRVLSLEGSLLWHVPRGTRLSCVSGRYGWLWSPGLTIPVSTRRSVRSPRSWASPRRSR